MQTNTAIKTQDKLNENHSFDRTPVIVLGELSLVHCIGLAGIPAITASEQKPTGTAYSRYSGKHVIFSSYDTDQFISELLELGKELGQKAILVTYDDRVILNVSKHRDRLKEHFLLLMPEHETVEKLLDKVQFYELAEQVDLPIPKTIRVSSEKEMVQRLDSLQAPYLIKPAYRHYWYSETFAEKIGQYQKALTCSTVEELRKLYSQIIQVNPHVVVQEYVVGEDSCMYDVNLFVDKDGETKGYVIAQKLRVYPPVAGWGSHVRTLHDDEIYNTCLEIINKLDLKGMINIQFKRDSRSGEYRLIEIHPRTSIFDILGARAGQNIPGLYYSYLTGNGDAVSRGSYKDEVRYTNLSRDLKLFLRYRKRYNLSLGKWARSYMKTSVYDGLLLKDFYAFLRSLSG